MNVTMEQVNTKGPDLQYTLSILAVAYSLETTTIG